MQNYLNIYIKSDQLSVRRVLLVDGFDYGIQREVKEVVLGQNQAYEHLRGDEEETEGHNRKKRNHNLVEYAPIRFDSAAAYPPRSPFDGRCLIHMFI